MAGADTFQIHRFINHFFGVSIIVPKYPMIQVASCEQALIKTNRKLIENLHSKTVLLFKTYTLEFEFDRHLKRMVSYQGMQNGLAVLLSVNSALSRFLCKMTVLQSLIFHISPTGNIKSRSYLDRYDHILPFTNHKSTLLRFWFIYKAENIGIVENEVPPPPPPPLISS